MVEGWGKLVKFLVLVINFFLLVAGISILGVGIWTYVDKTVFEFLLGSNRYIVSASILFIIIGILSTLFSLIGFCGAYREKRWLLIIYFAVIFIIFCLIIASIVLAYIFRSEMDERMSTEMYSSIKSYDNDTKIKDSWHLLQRTFKCCGVAIAPNLPADAYKSWKAESKLFQAGPAVVPESCCKVEEKDCNVEASVPDKIFTDDCFEKIKSYVKEHSLIIGIIAVFVAFLLLFAMTLSCLLFCMIKH